MVHAWEQGCREFIVGLGGSATSDCGLGMLRCLRHHAQQQLHQMWYDLFDTSVLKSVRVTLASDVNNPLTGPCGAAHVFAPQKGADARQVELLERRATTFAAMAAKHQGYDMSQRPGAVLRWTGLCVHAVHGCSDGEWRRTGIAKQSFRRLAPTCRSCHHGRGRVRCPDTHGQVAECGVASCAEGRSTCRSCQWAHRRPKSITRRWLFPSCVYQRRTTR